jgi:uncharacterized membrane protein YtjA (UPF0391 family)
LAQNQAGDRPSHFHPLKRVAVSGRSTRKNLFTLVFFSSNDLLTRSNRATWPLGLLLAGSGAKGNFAMLNWALIFFIVAVIAAIFGFGGIAVASAGIAKILFFLFLILFVISLISGLTRRV